MKITNKKLIIFDLDGTLIDSVPDLAFALNSMLLSFTRQQYSEKTVHEWVGNGAQMLVKRGLSGNKRVDDSLSDETIQKALTLFLDIYTKNVCVKTQMYDNVLSTLQSLKQQKYALVIVTNKPFALIEPILISLGLQKIFDLFIGGDSLESKKPDPLPLLYVCEKLNIDVNDSIMVGDSKNDIIAAQNAHMDSIGVTYGYNYGEDISIYNPTFVIDNIADILKIFD